MDYLISEEVINEVHDLEQQVYQTDETSEPDTIEALNVSNGLNDYINWMETQLLKRKANRLNTIMEVCQS